MTTPDPIAEAAAEREEEKETARIEAFSDGVFAIAITLLILEVKVPHLSPGAAGAAGAHGAAEARSLAASLAHQWPEWLAFLASFFTIGVMWLNHHRLFTLIRRSDDRLLVYNSLLLLAVTIVPFPTALFAEYLRTEEVRTASTIYAAHGLLVALAFTLLWRHAVMGNLIGSRIPKSAVADIWRQYRFGPLFYVIAIALAQWSGVATMLWCFGLAIFFIVPPAALRRPTCAAG